MTKEVALQAPNFVCPTGYTVQTTTHGVKYYVGPADKQEYFSLSKRTLSYLNNEKYTGLKWFAGKVGHVALIIIFPLDLLASPVVAVVNFFKKEVVLLASMTGVTKNGLKANPNPLEFKGNLGLDSEDNDLNALRDQIAPHLVSFVSAVKNFTPDEAWALFLKNEGNVDPKKLINPKQEFKGDARLQAAEDKRWTQEMRDLLWNSTADTEGWESPLSYFEGHGDKAQEKLDECKKTSQEDFETFKKNLEKLGKDLDAAHTETFADLAVGFKEALQAKGVAPETIALFDRFMNLLGTKKAFGLLSNCPGKFLYFDKVINDAIGDKKVTLRDGSVVPMDDAAQPVVGSTVPLMREGENEGDPLVTPTYKELLTDLIGSVFAPEKANWVAADKIEEARDAFLPPKPGKEDKSLDNPKVFGNILASLGMTGATQQEKEELKAILIEFAAVGGVQKVDGKPQVAPNAADGLKMAYCFYHALALKIVADANLLPELDQLKEGFAELPLCDLEARAQTNKTQTKGKAYVCMQEPDLATIKALTEEADSEFLPVKKQIDLCKGKYDALVFLNKNVWNPNYRVLEIKPDRLGAEYPAHDRKRIMVIEAQEKRTGQWFTVHSYHADAEDPTNGWDQLGYGMRASQEAAKSRRPTSQGLPASVNVIGMDRNTKTEEHCKDYVPVVRAFGLQQLSDKVVNLLKRRAFTPMSTKVLKLDASRSDNQMTDNHPAIRWGKNSTKIGGVPEANASLIAPQPSREYPSSDHQDVEATLEFGHYRAVPATA